MESAGGHRHGGYLVAAGGGLGGVAVAWLTTWLYDVATPVGDAAMTYLLVGLFIGMVGPFVGVSLGAWYGLWLRGHGGGGWTALVAAALSIPGFYLAWFQFDRLPYSSVLLVLLLVSLPLVARRVALLARDFGL